MRLTAHEVSWHAGGRTIIDSITFDALPGATVGIVGPNGSGKSTLLRCLAGLRPPSGGAVRYDGADITGWSAKRLAERVAFVDQDLAVDSDLRVSDVVALGRTSHRSAWRGLTAADQAIVAAEPERLGLTALRERPWRTLSGGERQRAHIARALAQQPAALLLDEPTNHLDIRHQLELLQLLARTPQTVLVSLHDLTLAARFCDRLVLLDDGALVAFGDPADVLTPERLRAVFEVDAELDRDRFGNPMVCHRDVAVREGARAC